MNRGIYKMGKQSKEDLERFFMNVFKELKENAPGGKIVFGDGHEIDDVEVEVEISNDNERVVVRLIYNNPSYLSRVYVLSLTLERLTLNCGVLVISSIFSNVSLYNKQEFYDIIIKNCIDLAEECGYTCIFYSSLLNYSTSYTLLNKALEKFGFSRIWEFVNKRSGHRNVFYTLNI